MHTTLPQDGERRVPKPGNCFCTIVPPFVLERLAESDDPKVSESARTTLEADAEAAFRAHRAESPSLMAPAAPAAEPRLERTVFDAHHGLGLPGDVVRPDGADPVADGCVNRAYDALGLTFHLYKEAYGRNSVDGNNMPLNASVHYRRGYNNAFWDGERMVFGDGDGQVFNDFTVAVDIPAHEMTHAVTQFTAGLVYQDQSGALNESISDVFGSLAKQFARRQTAEQADWLIGAGIFTPTVQAQGLRSLKAPGTAFNDPRLGGKDPQPDNMAAFVETSQDDGGVHTNSGIPNHAFYLVAIGIGGFSWEKAGQIWYDTITSGELDPNATFQDFARATLAAAARRYGKGLEYEAVLKAWSEVGVSGNSNG
ncbi:M4 family metallopeptidase [Streptomyces sp. NPDC059080]|uniref:M4 family metallopeptidase n=1 Tax=Streptomyces sp. NPDC059080 TaxID=3346718 RepID=UPI00368095A1